MIERNLLVGAMGLVTICAAIAQEESEIASSTCPDEDRDVSLLSFREPYYPHSAAMFCLSGHVKARFVVDREGRTRDIEIVESTPGAVFDRSAVEAIEQWQFIPACRDGERVSRNASQSIDFNVPRNAEEHCPDAIGRLDGETARLIGEVGARYALLIEHGKKNRIETAIADTIVSPLGDFDGDLARVARFHRRTLEHLVAFWPEKDLADLFDSAYMALMPSSLGLDDGLERAHERLAQYHGAVQEQLGQWHRVHADHADAYRKLRRDTQLDPETLELLVKPFVGNPEASFEETVKPALEPLIRLQDISKFLEQRRGEWRVADNQIHFDHNDDQIEWRALWQEFDKHHYAFLIQSVRALRTFEDYSD